jgi:hypothetical protein
MRAAPLPFVFDKPFYIFREPAITGGGIDLAIFSDEPMLGGRPGASGLFSRIAPLPSNN